MSSTSNKVEFVEGLEDVVAGVSQICFIDGKEGRLIYRGYDINELVDKTTFEEVMYLMWKGELPNDAQLNDLRGKIREFQQLPQEIIDAIRLLAPKSSPMDTLRTAVSMLKSYDEKGDEIKKETNIEQAIKLTSVIPIIVAAIGRIREGKDIMLPKQDLSIAANFLYMLKGKEADQSEVRVMDAGLIMHADHELNASTFACRVTCATLSDIYSAVTSGIGTLKGPLHGGANTAVMKMLLEIGSRKNVEKYVEEKLKKKEKISGFGHRVYRTMDPRAKQLRHMSRELAVESGETKWIDMTDKVFEVVNREKGMWPNVDLYSASAYYVMGINIELFTPIFAMSRVVGWTAHILEQYENNRLIRPTSIYRGPELRPVQEMDYRQ